jgi:hypothetical protein
MKTFQTIEEVASIRKQTLTSGYDRNNTMFVRVKDGYSVGADPAPVKKTNQEGQIFYAPHHVCGEGYLYRTLPGYIIATTKAGCRGWSSWVYQPQNTELDCFVSFNPFEGLRTWVKEIFHDRTLFDTVIYQTPIEEQECPVYLDEIVIEQREDYLIGTWCLPCARVGEPYYSETRVYGIPFKGINALLGRLCYADRRQVYIFPFNTKRYNYYLARYEVNGRIYHRENKTRLISSLFEENFSRLEGLFTTSHHWDPMYGKIAFKNTPEGVMRYSPSHNPEGLDYCVFEQGTVWERTGGPHDYAFEEELIPVEGVNWLKEY